MQNHQLVDHRYIVAIKSRCLDQQEAPVDLLDPAELFITKEFNKKIRCKVIARRKVVEGQPDRRKQPRDVAYIVVVRREMAPLEHICRYADAGQAKHID